MMITSRAFLWISFTLTTAILGAISGLQLWLFGAGADLGFFEQLLFLQGQGLPPISTLYKGIHLVGDHFSLILYPIAVLYKIYPNIYWLLLIQSASLASGIFPVYALCKQFDLSKRLSQAFCLCYLLYPLIFNINFYGDFRPEVIALPTFLWALHFIRKNRIIPFYLSVIVILATKEIMALSIFSLGAWLALFQKRRWHGLFTMLLSIGWIVVAFGVIIPNFRGDQGIASLGFYSYLGSSLGEISQTLLLNPALVLKKILSPDNLGYWLLLLLPIILCLKPSKVHNLVPASIPLLMNALSSGWQRDLIHHYSLPILPFLIYWAIDSSASFKKRGQRKWLRPNRIVIWSVIAFLALAKYGYFYSSYLPKLPEASALHELFPLVKENDKLLTSSHLVSHFTGRPHIQMVTGGNWNEDEIKAEDFDAILLSRPFAAQNETERVEQFIAQLSQDSNQFKVFESPDQQSFLFRKINQPSKSVSN